MTERLLHPFARNHFFYGKLMTARDFAAEQQYHAGKLQLHHRWLHDWGVVWGLGVCGAGDPASPWQFVLSPGLAVDAFGREIVVERPFGFDLKQLLERQGIDPTALTGPFYVAIHYQECRLEMVPIYARQCADEAQCAPNRIQEGFRLSLQTEAPVGQADGLCSLVQAAVKPDATASLYQMLVQRKLTMEPAMPESDGLVLAAIPFATGLPDGANVDNLAHRKILLTSGETAALLGCLVEVTAKCCNAGPTPAAELGVSAGDPVRETREGYSVTATALLTREGAPMAGETVTWAVSPDDGVWDITPATDATGQAQAVLKGLKPDTAYVITAAAAGATASAPVVTPALKPAKIEVAGGIYELRNGALSRPLTATVFDQDGYPLGPGVPLAWNLQPGGLLALGTNAMTDAAGQALNRADDLKPGESYLATAKAGGIEGELKFTPVAFDLKGEPAIRDDGTYDLSLTAWPKLESGGPAAAGTPVYWASQPKRTFYKTPTRTTEKADATALAQNLQSGVMYILTAATAEGLGKAEHQPLQPATQPAAINLAVTGVTKEANGTLAVKLTASVLDQQKRPVAGVAVVWRAASSLALKADAERTERDGTVSATVTGLTPNSGATEVAALAGELRDVLLLDPNQLPL